MAWLLRVASTGVISSARTRLRPGYEEDEGDEGADPQVARINYIHQVIILNER